MIQNKQNIIDINSKINKKNFIQVVVERDSTNSTNAKHLLDYKQSSRDSVIQWKHHSKKNLDSNSNKDLEANNLLQQKENDLTNKNYSQKQPEDNSAIINDKNKTEKQKNQKNKKFEIDENSNLKLKYDDEADITSEAAQEKLNMLKANLSFSSGIQQEIEMKSGKKDAFNFENDLNNNNREQVAGLVANSNNRDNNNYAKKDSEEFVLSGIENENENENFHSVKNKNISNIKKK